MKVIDNYGRLLTQLSLSALEPGVFGDGKDGTLVLDGTNSYTLSDGAVLAPGGSNYSLPRSIFCLNLTVGSASSNITLKTAGFKIFCLGTLTVLSGSSIANVGTNATTQTGANFVASGDVGGSGSGATGGAGGTSGAGTAGTSPSPVAAFMGGIGGTSGAGGTGGGGAGGGGSAAGGNAGTPPVNLRTVRTVTPHLIAGATLILGGTGGGGGGGGGWNGAGTTGGAGGGGGSGGGVIMIFATGIVINGTITVAGGNGFAGASGTGTSPGAPGGGGGGGGGGLLYLVYNTLIGAAGLNVLGGQGGAGSSANPGSIGNSGIVVRFNGVSRSWE